MITLRQQKLLEKIIKEFVATAQPVSSKALEESGFLGVSSATIRSEMNELEHAGYLEQPHTSAGRVPSDKAYRYFVDKVVKAEPMEISSHDKKRIHETIKEVPAEPRQINKALAQVLSDLTENLVITNIMERDDFFKIGLKNLFEFPEFQQLERMFRLTSFFEEFSNMHLGDFNNVFGQEIRVFIGRESPFRGITQESVICAEYNLPDGFTGSVTLIGPTRMNYKKNIGLVRYATDELNEAYG